MIDIDSVIETCLIAIYSNDVLNKKLYLKGGQALRIAYDQKTRLSADADFSMEVGIEEADPFFDLLRKSLYSEFSNKKFYLFDFKFTKKPKKNKDGAPDFWRGWEVEFKLITKDKMGDPLDKQRREAIVPEGSESPTIRLDISEFEYCKSIEKIKVKSVEVKVYSQVLIVLEKLRAICQQHPDYKLKSTTADRARDYYDIERIYYKIIQKNGKKDFLLECSKHLKKVFEAKGVDTQIIKSIFDESFVRLQAEGWEAVKATVNMKTDNFDYYLETLRDITYELQVLKAY